MRSYPKFLLLLIFSFSFLVNAQKKSDEDWKFKFGAKLNLERTVCGNFYPKFSNSAGMGVQALIRVKQSCMSIQTGLNIASHEFTDYGTSVFKFVTVPLNVHYNKLGFYFAGGPFVDYLYDIKGARSSDAGFLIHYCMGPNFIVGYEKKLVRDFFVFTEAKYMFEWKFTQNQTRFEAYGISCGINYALK